MSPPCCSGHKSKPCCGAQHEAMGASRPRRTGSRTRLSHKGLEPFHACCLCLLCWLQINGVLERGVPDVGDSFGVLLPDGARRLALDRGWLVVFDCYSAAPLVADRTSSAIRAPTTSHGRIWSRAVTTTSTT
jgi:hypothetical protein